MTMDATSKSTCLGRAILLYESRTCCTDKHFNFRYIRSHMHLDDLEKMARFPPVDKYGKPTMTVLVDQAGSHGE